VFQKRDDNEMGNWLKTSTIFEFPSNLMAVGSDFWKRTFTWADARMG
jgi:hypothetical protein